MQVTFAAPSRRSAARLLGLVLTALTLLAAGRADAQGDKDVATARAVFVEASKLAEQGRWEEARLRYLLALRLRRAAITFYSLGVVDKELGRLVEARESFRAFLDEPSTSATKGFEEPARQALAEIDSSLAAARAAESTQAPGPAPSTVPVGDPPPAPVVAAAPPPLVPVAPPPSVPVAGPDRTVPFALIGGGTALFIAGVVTGLVGLTQAGNAPGTMGPEAEAARTKGFIGDALGGVGLVTAGAGVIVLLLQKRPEPAKAASVRPWIGGTSAGVVVRF
jgi:hypothetical protein